MTPTMISSGDSQRRSSEKTIAISAVPTSAPSMITSAGPSAIRPWLTNELAISAVALDDCTSAVDAKAREESGGAIAHALGQDVAQVGAEDAQDPGAHDMRAPHEQGDAG